MREKRSFLRTMTMSVMFCIMPRSMLATHPKYVFKAFVLFSTLKAVYFTGLGM